MIKLFVQKDNNKFVNNILLSKYDNIQLFSTDINNNLYELFYRIGFDSCIFMASKINPEMYQFIKEFANGNIRIFLYHSIINNALLDLQFNNLTHLIETQTISSKLKNTIVLPQLINKDLFNNSQSNKKLDFISCFLDNVTDIPNILLQKLYPNSKLPIKLFNNPNIKHHQNLGILTEHDKAYILSKSEFYVSIDHYYAAEASASGCKVLDMTELDDMREQKYKHIKTPQTYSKYIEKLLCN